MFITQTKELAVALLPFYSIWHSDYVFILHLASQLFLLYGINVICIGCGLRR